MMLEADISTAMSKAIQLVFRDNIDLTIESRAFSDADSFSSSGCQGCSAHTNAVPSTEAMPNQRLRHASVAKFRAHQVMSILCEKAWERSIAVTTTRSVYFHHHQDGHALFQVHTQRSFPAASPVGHEEDPSFWRTGSGRAHTHIL